MDRAEYQVVQVIFACGLGLSLGLFYDFYRLWLRGGRQKKGQTIGDVLWWTFALAWTFFWLLMLNWAELRFLIVFMVVAGLALYIFCFSPILLPIFTKLWRLISKILAFVLQIIRQALWLVFSPLVGCSSLVYKFGLGFGRFWQKFLGKAKGNHKKRQTKVAAKREAKHKQNQRKSQAKQAAKAKKIEAAKVEKAAKKAKSAAKAANSKKSTTKSRKKPKE